MVYFVSMTYQRVIELSSVHVPGTYEAIFITCKDFGHEETKATDGLLLLLSLKSFGLEIKINERMGKDKYIIKNVVFCIIR
jgi:hypothetical protein